MAHLKNYGQEVYLRDLVDNQYSKPVSTCYNVICNDSVTIYK